MRGAWSATATTSASWPGRTSRSCWPTRTRSPRWWATSRSSRCCAATAATASSSSAPTAPRGPPTYAEGGTKHSVEARPADQLVDTTGAGDAYAGGFLYGLVRGFELPVAGRIGSAAASHVVAQLGAQPPENLKAKVAE